MVTICRAWGVHRCGVVLSRTWTALYQLCRSFVTCLTGIGVGTDTGLGRDWRKSRAMGADWRCSSDWGTPGLEYLRIEEE